jgi:hypothetical protein
MSQFGRETIDPVRSVSGCVSRSLPAAFPVRWRKRTQETHRLLIKDEASVFLLDRLYWQCTMSKFSAEQLPEGREGARASEDRASTAHCAALRKDAKAMDELGEFYRDFKVRGLGSSLAIVGVSALLGATSLWGGLALSRSRRPFPENAIGIGIGGIFILAAAYVLIYEVYTHFTGPPRARGRISLYEGGLLINGQEIGWKEIEAIDGCPVVKLCGAPVHLGGSLVLSLADGSDLMIPSCNGHAVLAGRILGRTTKRLLKRALNSIESGEPVAFGAVFVDEEAINCGGDRLLWSHFAALSFDCSHMYIHQEGKKKPWRSVALKELRSPNLLIALTHSLTGRVTDRYDGPPPPLLA